jgi:hypothetical protein
VVAIVCPAPHILKVRLLESDLLKGITKLNSKLSRYFCLMFIVGT